MPQTSANFATTSWNKFDLLLFVWIHNLGTLKFQQHLVLLFSFPYRFHQLNRDQQKDFHSLSRHSWQLKSIGRSFLFTFEFFELQEWMTTAGRIVVNNKVIFDLRPYSDRIDSVITCDSVHCWKIKFRRRNDVDQATRNWIIKFNVTWRKQQFMSCGGTTFSCVDPSWWRTPEDNDRDLNFLTLRVCPLNSSPTKISENSPRITKAWLFGRWGYGMPFEDWWRRMVLDSGETKKNSCSLSRNHREWECEQCNQWDLICQAMIWLPKSVTQESSVYLHKEWISTPHSGWCGN